MPLVIVWCMSAGRTDFIFEEFADTDWIISLTSVSGPIDLTDAELFMDVKESTDAGSTIVQLNTDNGRLSIYGNPLNGQFRLRLPWTVSQALDFDEAVYDLVISYPDTTRVRVLQGKVKLSRGVTDPSV